MMRRVLSLLILLCSALGILPAVAAESTSKFHLVYLVAAVDHKPGAKVTVDPIFFTDGRGVKNFHDFCRSPNKPLKSEQIVGARKFIVDYCARKTFTLDPKGYHTLNNHGQQVMLDPIEFKVVDHIVQTKEPVMMGSSKVSSYTPGTIEPPKWLRQDGAPEYFFLMAKDKTILEKIVPISKATDAEVQILVKRAEEFSKLTKGKMAGTPRHLNEIDKAKDCQPSSTVTQFRLENPLIADLDLDGKLDMLVSILNVVRLDGEPDKPLVDCFTRYKILSNGDTFLMGNTQWPRTPWAKMNFSSGGFYDRYLHNGYAPRAPLMVIVLPGENRRCSYGMEYVVDGLLHPNGLSLWSGISKCPSIGGLQKFRSIHFEDEEREKWSESKQPPR